MDKKELEKLRHLSPEERIRKLKELEDKKKKEIEEARTLLRHSEEELFEGQVKREKIPIEQLKADDSDMLLTLEDQEMFMIKRFLTKKDLKVLRDKDLDELEKMLNEEKINAEEQQVSDWERQQVIQQQQAASQAYAPAGQAGSGALGIGTAEMYSANPPALQQQLEFYANEIQEMYQSARDGAGVVSQSTMDRFYQIQSKFERAATYSDLDANTATALSSLDQALNSVKYSSFRPEQ